MNKCQEKVDSKPSKHWFVTVLYLSDIRELKMGVQTGHYKAWKGKKKIIHKGAWDRLKAAEQGDSLGINIIRQSDLQPL